MPQKKEDVSSEDIVQANRVLYQQVGEHYEDGHWYFKNHYEQHYWTKEVDSIGKQLAPGAKVLDVGAGTGNYSLKFLKWGVNVTALDLSENILKVLRDRTKQIPDRIEFVVDDIESFLRHNDTSYDVVVAGSLLHHILEYLELVEQFCAIVKTGGFLYFPREPVEQQELTPPASMTNFSSKLYRRIESYLYSIKRRMVPAKVNNAVRPDADCVHVSCYHDYIGTGVSHKSIQEVCKKEGLDEIYYRRWNARQFSVVSYLENVILNSFRKDDFQKTYFSVIFKRS